MNNIITQRMYTTTFTRRADVSDNDYMKAVDGFRDHMFQYIENHQIYFDLDEIKIDFTTDQRRS